MFHLERKKKKEKRSRRRQTIRFGLL